MAAAAVGNQENLFLNLKKISYERIIYNIKHNLEQKEACKITYLAEYWFTISDFMS